MKLPAAIIENEEAFEKGQARFAKGDRQRMHGSQTVAGLPGTKQGARWI